MFLQYFVVYFFNHFACFEAFQWTFHPYGFRGDGWGGRYFPGVGRMNWGERILCRNGGLWRIEEGVLMRSAGFWRVQVTSEVREVWVGFKRLIWAYMVEICWWLWEEERIVTKSTLVNWVSDQSECFLRMEHFDPFLFCSGVWALPMEGWRCGVCPRRSVAGAWSRVGASGCWSSGGAAFAIFNSAIGGKYVVIFELKT